MKKIVSIGLCLLLVFSLAACGSSASNGDPDQTTPAQTTAPTEEPAALRELNEENAQSMINAVEEVSSLEKAGKGQAEIKEYLEGQEWVETVSKTPDGGLTCISKFGVTGVWTPKEEDTIGGAAEALRQHTEYLHSIAPDSGNGVGHIALLIPYASEDPRFKIEGYQFLCDSISKETGCKVTTFSDGAVSLNFLKTLDQFDMVIFYSHGALVNSTDRKGKILASCPYTMTGEFAKSPLILIRFFEDFQKNRAVIDLGDGRIGVGAQFYMDHYSEKQLPGTFFHFASCNSMRNDMLADALISRGASWVEGWNNKVSFANDYMQFSGVVDALVAGKDIHSAIKFADAAVKERYAFYQQDCLLKGKGDETYNLITEDELLEELHGTYKGSYFATQGETAVTLSVYKSDKTYRALFDFYNLPGHTNAQSGKYFMDVSYDYATDEFVFSSTEWIEKPATYDFVDLRGKLADGVLSGESPTRFSVIKMAGNTGELEVMKKAVPEDAFAYNGHYYKLYVDVCATWEEAEAYCKSVGGHLAVIADAGENEALYGYITSLGQTNAYFGFSDSAEEGSWQWVNGLSSEYTNWHSGEPNNEQSTEDYAMFYWKYTDGTWNDGNYGHGTQADDRNFICEWE